MTAWSGSNASPIGRANREPGQRPWQAAPASTLCRFPPPPRPLHPRKSQRLVPMTFRLYPHDSECPSTARIPPVIPRLVDTLYPAAPGRPPGPPQARCRLLPAPRGLGGLPGSGGAGKLPGKQHQGERHNAFDRNGRAGLAAPQSAVLLGASSSRRAPPIRSAPSPSSFRSRPRARPTSSRGFWRTCCRSGWASNSSSRIAPALRAIPAWARSPAPRPMATP